MFEKKSILKIIILFFINNAIVFTYLIIINKNVIIYNKFFISFFIFKFLYLNFYNYQYLKIRNSKLIKKNSYIIYLNKLFESFGFKELIKIYMKIYFIILFFNDICEFYNIVNIKIKFYKYYIKIKC